MTLFRFLLGMALLALPLYILYAFRVKIVRNVLVGASKMLGGMTLTALCLYFVMMWDSLLVSLLCFFLMALAAAVATVHRSRLKDWHYVVPVAVGVIVSVIVIGLYFLFFVLGLQNPFDARYFLPVLGPVGLLCRIGAPCPALLLSDGQRSYSQRGRALFLSPCLGAGRYTLDSSDGLYDGGGVARHSLGNAPCGEQRLYGSGLSAAPRDTDVCRLNKFSAHHPVCRTQVFVR